MNILVTGGAGFIGSNFIKFILNKYQSYHVVNLDLLTYAGDLINLSDIVNSTNYTFVEGDICNRALIEDLFKTYKFKAVIHFAAESHVDNSISNPERFIKTNVNGTFTLLDVAKKFWLQVPHSEDKDFLGARFHHISTDEVFGSLGEKGFFTENTAYAPNSPYSASKASSDMLVRSYFHTYGMNVVTTNCSNNYGPLQHDEKLIPTIIRNALKGNTIPIYGDGKNIRDWLYVEDHCAAIDKVFHYGKAGETYLVGGDNEIRNIDIAEIICEQLDINYPHLLNEFQLNSFKKLIKYVEDRAGHDFRYAIDASKLKSELQWQPKVTFTEGIQKTLNYYSKKYLI